MDDRNAVSPSSYLQNRELSWLDFNKRVLDQGADETVPLLERLNFISIFWSNLQEFFMVRVGSLTDLSLVKKQILDTKSGMTPAQQLDAIYRRCFDLYTDQETIYGSVRAQLAERGIRRLHHKDLNDEQRSFLSKYAHDNIIPFLSPQIINSRHPFPHLENGALYVVLRLDEDNTSKKAAKNHGAEGVTLGLVPMPRQCPRVIQIPGDGFQYVLLEHAIEMVVDEVFNMYSVKHTNIICVTRNADLDASEGTDESDYDYREHMKRILKKRTRLAPVRLESERKLSDTLRRHLLDRLGLKPHQAYATCLPLNMSYTFGLASRLPENLREGLVNKPFSPQWPPCLSRKERILDQVSKRDVLLSYPYESMEPFVRLLQEAAADPEVISIKITLYRLASQSQLAEALIAAAERGKQVTALFELRARFDENNNIEWSQRFEQAGCNVIYGFRDYKVHSKICCITRRTKNGPQSITQLGTGNYNEKTARLYTDFSYITADADIGRDAAEFFRNMALESTSNSYEVLWVAPLQIKPMILANIDEQMRLAEAGKPCGLFFKTNSVTDIDIMEKIEQASRAGVPITMFVRGISCLVPGVADHTENVRVVSIVGRLLEHSRIYGFGPADDMSIYLSSADLMTRNMDKRIEIAWPVRDESLRTQVIDYLNTCMADTAKLRELRSDRTYTPLRYFLKDGEAPFDAQAAMIEQAYDAVASDEARKSEKKRIKKAQKLAKEQQRATEAAAAQTPEATMSAQDDEAVTTSASTAECDVTHEESPAIKTVVPDAIEPPLDTTLAVSQTIVGAAADRDDPSAIVRFLARTIVRLKKRR
ncbi:polyphosphate kinase 1 [Adlercreutzia sp. ZJ141]|uniref:polyphosphate kinase 1 n=1 Tax=Adlercreutzia sp. ZJ141 TaxID=2709406 RepID=UPI001F15645A|nr:polyphosphate kinase 1 [Adlercreutzia sp. ZJ141]